MLKSLKQFLSRRRYKIVEEEVEYEVDLGRVDIIVLMKNGENFKHRFIGQHSVNDSLYYMEYDRKYIGSTLTAKYMYKIFLDEFPAHRENFFIQLVNADVASEVAVRSSEVDKIVNVQHIEHKKMFKRTVKKKVYDDPETQG